jgi:hypothetical protein
MTSVLLALWLAHPGTEVTGDSSCPTPAEVLDRLAAIAPASQEDAAAKPGAHVANVSGVGSGVHIELLDRDGQLVAERTLERTGSCGEVAEAVAVIVSAWEAKFNPNLATPVVRPPLPPPYEPVTKAVVEEPNPQSGRPMSFDAGLAALVSIAGSDTAYGLKLEGCLFPAIIPVPLGLDIALAASTTHSQSIAVPSSAAQWTRAALSVGPTFRFGQNSAILDVHGGGVLAALHVQGTGLSSTSSDTTAQLGVAAGLRLVRAGSKAAGWIGADVYAYPGQDRLTIGNYGEAGRLPRVEVQIALGVSAGQFP